MIELSKLNPLWESDEVINFLLDNGYNTVVNDLTPAPQIQYDYSDMYQVWNKLRTII